MANILVLIPISNKLPPALRWHCRFLTNRLKRANPQHKIEIVFDSRGPGWNHRSKNFDDFKAFNRIIAPIRQALIDDYLKSHHDYVFWIDADLLFFPANLPSKLIELNPTGISAPMVFLEGQGRRFFDLAGFIENGRQSRFFDPFFQQAGPVYDLDSVGCIYLVPAEIYRQGAKHEFIEGFTEHLSVCTFARRRLLPVRAFENLVAVHYSSELWHFKKSDGFLKIIFQLIKLRLKSLSRANQSLTRKDSFADKKEVRNQFFDKVKKGVFVLVNYPWQIFKSPMILKTLFYFFKQNNLYQALQKSYDLLIIKKDQAKGMPIKNLDNLAQHRALYDNFIKTNFNDLKIKELKSRARQLRFKPKISVILPVYDVDLNFLGLAISSVKRQVYDNWELCIANGSQREEIREFLKYYLLADPRIKLLNLSSNGGISQNSNEALKLATGDYVALLDHDDELSPDALFEVAQMINAHPEADLIYSDEDKIDLDGNYRDYNFKPDWCPDLLLTCCYLGHLVVIKKNIVNQVGGFRKQFDGSQDHDLFLRITEITDKIFHIPKILYHWKMSTTSTACSIDNKPYCYEKTILAVEEALKRRGIKGWVATPERLGQPLYVHRAVSGEDFVSIFIPTKDQPWLLRNLIVSLLNKTTYQNYEIIIINNNSQTIEARDCFVQLKKLSNKIRVIDYNKEFNYSAINNYAVKFAKGNLFLFLNDDMEVINSEWLLALVEQIKRPEVGAVGGKLLFYNNIIQHAGVILGYRQSFHAFKWEQDNGQADYLRNYSAVTGACLMVKKETFFEIEGFDENYEVIYSDIDLCLKIRQKGYLIVYTPLAKLYHLESITRGLTHYLADEIRFHSCWLGVLSQADPYYNHNLSREITSSFFWSEEIANEGEDKDFITKPDSEFKDTGYEEIYPASSNKR